MHPINSGDTGIKDEDISKSEEELRALKFPFNCPVKLQLESPACRFASRIVAKDRKS